MIVKYSTSLVIISSGDYHNKLRLMEPNMAKYLNFPEEKGKKHLNQQILTCF